MIDDADKLLATLCAQRAPAAAASLSILQNGEELHLSSDDTGSVSQATRENSLRLPASDIIKPFTATAIVEAFHDMQLPLESDVATLRRCSSRVTSSANGQGELS